jgi:hypothetical protein
VEVDRVHQSSVNIENHCFDHNTAGCATFIPLRVERHMPMKTCGNWSAYSLYERLYVKLK